MATRTGRDDLSYQPTTPAGENYHFLSRALGQSVPIAQIVDLNVFDVVSVGNIHFGLGLAIFRLRSRAIGLEDASVFNEVLRCQYGGLYRADWRDVDMLNTLLGLELRIDLRRGRSCGKSPKRVSNARLSGIANKSFQHLPAAAAGSGLLEDSLVGLRGSRLNGLRVRTESDCRADGDRERRSKRERRGSGSV